MAVLCTVVMVVVTAARVVMCTVPDGHSLPVADTGPTVETEQSLFEESTSNFATMTELKYEKVVDWGNMAGPMDWWYDASNPNAFSIFDPSQLYSQPYFTHGHDDGALTTFLVASFALTWCSTILGRPCVSIADMGAAECWFSNAFIRESIKQNPGEAANVHVVAVEASQAGVDGCIRRGFPSSDIRHMDLRKPVDLGERFDMVVCIEVAEHLEPPFAGTLVYNLVSHADVVWFSAFEVDTLPRDQRIIANVHHPNVRPRAFWRNLFQFYGYAELELPGLVHEAVKGRGAVVYFNTTEFDAHTLRTVIMNEIEDEMDAAGLDIDLPPSLKPNN